jgi:hypothetical protein
MRQYCRRRTAQRVGLRWPFGTPSGQRDQRGMAACISMDGFDITLIVCCRAGDSEAGNLDSARNGW